MDRLLRLLSAIIARHAPEKTIRPEDLREALSALIVCLPVYRTYLQAGQGGLSSQDQQWLGDAMKHALDLKPRPQPALIAFLMDLLQSNLPGEAETDFVMRFQQLSGPAMAKGVEDTSFYCFNRFVALNEVGGDPGHFGLSVAAFHQSCAGAGEHWPDAMLATSTHDTKRSEDVRARLAVLSEIPMEWAAAVRRWSALNEKHRRDDFPDRNAEYLFYQTLVGAWPLSVERAVACMGKASREAKQHTNWTEPNAAYDEALKHFITATMSDDAFLADFQKFVAQLLEAGQINSLAQTLIKLTAPGVPDVYQGTELWDLSLVDPDNRRPVDYTLREQLLAELDKLSAEPVWSRRAEGLPKLWLIQKVLQLRRRQPDCFGANSLYRPLAASGHHSAHVVAFARGVNGVAIVPRLVKRLGSDWGNTTLVLPQGGWLNELTGETISGGESKIAGLFKVFPVALLTKIKDS